MINSVNTAVSKAQSEGAQGTELEETKQKIQQICCASMRLRAQQDLYFVARPRRRADGKPGDAVDRALNQLR